MKPAFIAFFFLGLLLNMPMAMAVPLGGFEPRAAVAPSSLPLINQPVLEEPEYTVIHFQAASANAAGLCSLSTLSESEVQRLKDSVLTPGLVGNEISAGTPPDASRDKISDHNTLLVPNPGDNETAFQKEIPTEVLKPEELSPLQNQHIRGPFAFGLSIDDSLRAARCVNDETCAVLGEQLQLRNSGEGISGNVKDIYNAITSDLSKPDTKFSPEEADYLHAQIATEQDLETPDANHVYVQEFSRVPTADLMNHIRADNTLQAGVLTNCDKGSCILTLYSMFDKYFNSWFSGEMVVSTFGPTLWGQFRKMLVKSKRYNIVSAKIADYNPFKDLKSANRIAEINTEYDALKSGTVKPLKPSDFFAKYGNGPSALQISGEDVFRNYKRIFQRDTDLGGVFKEIYIDKKALAPGGFPPLEDALFSPEGALGKIKDLELRKKVFSYIGVQKEYWDTVGLMSDQLKPLASSKVASERIAGARGYMQIFKDVDTTLNLDLVDVFRKLPEAKLGDYWVFDPITQTYHNLVTADGKYFADNIVDKFINQGDFSTSILQKMGKTGVEAQSIQLYRIEAERFIGPVVLEDVAADKYGPEILVRLNGTGEVLTATPNNLDRIKANIDAFGGQKPQIVTGGQVPVRDKDGALVGLTPQRFSDLVLTADIMPGKLSTAKRNITSMYETAVARDWGKGSYTNLLSKQLQSQENFVKNYFNLFNPNVLESGIGWTAKMYGYWWVTRGLGSDQFSIYQLPREWTEVQFVPGESEYYNDAYVDFFANEGSDTGDLFQSVISKFPLPVVLGEVAKEYPTLQGAWDFINGGQGRSSPDNLAVFLFGSQSCPNCAAAIESPNSGRFDVQYISPESTNAFFLEHGKSKDSQEKGQYLLTFAHKTNIEGQMKGEPLDEINLVQARQDGTTCEQVSEELFLYGNVAKLIGAEKTGAVLAAAESLSYASFGMMGVFVTVANQLAIAPKMQDCVDDKEGYFASLFVPKPNQKNDAKAQADNLQKSVSANALDGIRSFADQVGKENNSPSLTDKVLNEATSKVKTLVDEAQQAQVAEAELRVTGSSSGYLRSQEVIYFWVGGGSLVSPNQYPTDGKTLISTEDGHTITLDNGTGTLTADGQILVDPEEADHVRLAAKDLSIPAVEIPQRLTNFQLSDTNQWLLSVNVRGETIVQDAALLDCIQQAVLDQSAVPLNSNNMSEAFGNAESVSTDVYPNIAIDATNNRILLGGQSPQNASGAGASINVFGDRHVIVTGAQNPPAGKFQSLLLENGSVLYKPQTNELIIWLRHHAQAVVKDIDVKNFAGTLTTTQNPATSCDEPAIALSVETDPATAATKLKGDNLTAGLQKNGPFQVFETDSKRFILYSKLVDGECKSFFRVINKATGEVYDQAIDSVSQGEDGTITIHTADGQTHELKFSDQNGKPVLTYDGASEVLRSAVGKGGSFYYDPTKGIYVAENAQLIPLNDNFKNQGISFQANPDGTASGKAGSNVFVINPTQGGQGLFNIPSLPESMLGAGAMILLLGIVCAGIYLDARRRKKIR